MFSLTIYLTLLITFSCSFCKGSHENFIKCMLNHSSKKHVDKFTYMYPPSTPSYSNLLESAEQNPRWLNSTSILKPQFIITPYTYAEIRATILCSKKHDLQIRLKSGGHDYEGLSYLCETSFVIVDLINLRDISVDLEEETAWVQTGATIGELYYSIALKSHIHGFPAGLCPSIGVGGHFSGGGFGIMLRKYGLAADNIIDAYIMNANGKILHRKSMGEDLFWAIRGGGGASFGVILAWKINLVRVPSNVTYFNIHKNLDNEGIKLVHKWQKIAYKFPENLFIRVMIHTSGGDGNGMNKTVVAVFESLFLGSKNKLLPLMSERFPELGLRGEDCIEMSWIRSVLYSTGYQNGEPLEVLLDRTIQYKSYFKAKSDFVEKPIPKNALKEIREKFMEEEIAFMIMDPFGGKMEHVSESALPFPHRKGNLFNIQYLVKWSVDGDAETKKHIDWINDLYEYMKSYVSGSPRGAYVNYRDLDLGINQQPNATSYSEAVVWGRKYFKGNFERLSRVKTRVDPENFFRNQQSIPLLYQ